MRVARALLLAILVLLVLSLPAFAYLYRAPLTIIESSSNAYTMLPVSVSSNNDWMAANGFMKTTALDTRVETLGGTDQPHMVTDDRTLTSVAVPADSHINLYFTTGEADLASMDIIAGYNGRVETEDVAALEPGQNFVTSFDGYVDMSTGSRPIAYKPGALLLEVSAAGTLTAGAINTDSYDITPIVFTAWTDVDVSDYIPSGATGVIVEIDTANNFKDTGVRKNGSTDDRRGDTEHYWAMIGVDSSQIFEVYLEDNTCHLYLRGYTDGNWIFKTDAVDVSLGGTGAWTDIDVTASTSSDAVGVIIEIIDNDGIASMDAGLRKNGSTDNRHVDVYFAGGHTFRVVGLDDDEVFEGYIEDTDVDFYLVGYVTSGATFATNATDKSLAGSGAWTDVDCSVEAPAATYLFFEIETAGGNDGVGFRENGLTDNIVTDITSDQGQGIVKCDVNQVSEAYEEDHTQSAFYLTGYTEYGIYPPFPNPTYLVSTSAGGGAIPSGEHVIVVTGTGGGGNIEIDVDSGTWTGSAAIGAGVTDTTADWRELISPTVAYTNEYTHTVGGALQLTYEPVNMIAGRVLVDETNAFDGAFCWGSNPTGVTVSLGSMTSSGQPSAGATPAVPTRDLLPDIDSSDWFVDPDVTGVLLTNPLRPLVTILSDTTTLTELQAWRLYGLAFVLLVTVGAAKAVRNHLLLAGIASGASIGVCVALTVFPFWSLVFAIGAVLGGVVAERSPSL